MKSISFWGSQHPVATRWLIFASIILLNFLSIHLAWWAFAHKIFLPLAWELGLGLSFLGLFIYPPKNWKGRWLSRKRFYPIHKTADALLILGTFLFLFGGTQQLSLEATGANGPQVLAVVYDIQSSQKTTLFGKIKQVKQKIKAKVQNQIKKRLKKHLIAKKRKPDKIPTEGQG